MSDIPTGRTYLGFVLTRTVVLFLVFLLCVALFGAGRWVAGLLTILLTAFGFVRHSLWIGKREAGPYSQALSPLMGWFGRAPAPPGIEAGKGRQRRGARHVSAERPGCRCRHRYR